MNTEQLTDPHTEQEETLRQQVKARWGNVVVRGFTRKADGTLLNVQLQDPHVPRSDNAHANRVSWDPRTDLLLGDQQSVDLFEWFEQQNNATPAKE